MNNATVELLYSIANGFLNYYIYCEKVKYKVTIDDALVTSGYISFEWVKPNGAAYKMTFPLYSHQTRRGGYNGNPFNFEAEYIWLTQITHGDVEELFGITVCVFWIVTVGKQTNNIVSC